MVQAGRDPRLAQEPLPERRVVGELGRDHLQRNSALQPEVIREIDDAHPTASEQLAHGVARDVDADQSLGPRVAHPSTVRLPGTTCKGRALETRSTTRRIEVSGHRLRIRSDP